MIGLANLLPNVARPARPTFPPLTVAQQAEVEALLTEVRQRFTRVEEFDAMQAVLDFVVANGIEIDDHRPLIDLVASLDDAALATMTAALKPKPVPDRPDLDNEMYEALGLDPNPVRPPPRPRPSPVVEEPEPAKVRRRRRKQDSPASPVTTRPGSNPPAAPVSIIAGRVVNIRNSPFWLGGD
jgi:hypothetical protein